MDLKKVLVVQQSVFTNFFFQQESVAALLRSSESDLKKTQTIFGRRICERLLSSRCRFHGSPKERAIFKNKFLEANHCTSY